MRIRAIALSAVIVVCATPSAASPMGPVVLDTRALTVSGEAYYSVRDMRRSSDLLDNRRMRSTVALLNVRRHLGNSVMFALRFGGANLDIDDVPDIRNNVISKFNGTIEPAYGASFGAIFLNRDTWNIAGVANYLGHFAHNGAMPGGSVNGNRVDYWDWSTGMQIQRHWNGFLPYVGLRYSTARIVYQKLGGQHNGAIDEQRQHLGYYAGVGFSGWWRWSGYLEGHLGDEQAVSASLGLRF